MTIPPCKYGLSSDLATVIGLGWGISIFPCILACSCSRNEGGFGDEIKAGLIGMRP